MKDLENRGWEDMKKKLDVALPQKNTGFFSWWKVLIPVLGIIGIVLAYIVFFEKTDIAVNSPHNGMVIGKALTIGKNQTDKAINDNSVDNMLNGDESNLNMQNVDKSGSFSTSSGSHSFDNHMLSEVSDFKAELNQSSKKEQVALYRNQTSKSPEQQSLQHYSTSIPKENLASFRQESPNLQAINSSITISTQEALTLHPKSNESTLNVEKNGSVVKRNITEPAFIFSKSSDILINDIEVMDNMIPVIANNHNFNSFSFLLKAGAFTHHASKYSGLTLMPEMNFGIGKQSIIFANAQARYRRTKESVITREFNSGVKEFFDSNNLYAPNEILISEQNVNVSSFDLGFDLGYRQRIIKNVYIGGYGFARINNIFNQSPVKDYKSEFSLITNAALSKVNRSYESSIEKYNFGAGLDITYNIGNRHVVYTKIDRTFDAKKNYELCLGYGFRIL